MENLYVSNFAQLRDMSRWRTPTHVTLARGVAPHVTLEGGTPPWNLSGVEARSKVEPTPPPTWP